VAASSISYKRPQRRPSMQEHRQARVAVGTLLDDQYRLEREIGAGGSAIVFEAVHPHTRYRFAVKVLRTGVVANASAIARFKRETQITNQVDHPAVVKLTHFGCDKTTGATYAVQELLTGSSLRAKLAAAPLPAAEVLGFAIPLADALVAAHACDVVHCDVKPENVFVEAEGGRVRLLDFGAARRANEPGGAPLGAVVGTLAYMAPEQARGDASIDGRVDVWALGVVLYEALTGAVPYTAVGLPQLCYAHAALQPKPVAAAVPGVPDALAEAVDRALRVDRDDRHATMRDLRNALIAARGDGAVGRQTAAPPPPGRPKVLLVDDDAPLRRTLLRALRDFEVRDVADGDEALRELDGPAAYDLVITDLNMPHVSGVEVVRAASKRGVPAIMISVQATVDTAVHAMRLGAVNFISKPFHPEALHRAITDVLAARRIAPSPVCEVEGVDPEFRSVVSMAEEVAASGATVLITGETGTGKEVVARFIHRLGARRDRPFVSVDARNLDPATAERDLFGYRRGAFPGADHDHPGFVAQAEGATLFLDEVGALPPAVQSRVGRLVADRTYSPVGDANLRRASVHVIAASQGDLHARVVRGQFPADLYYRLAVVTLPIPPLRERTDLEALAARFVATAAYAARKPISGLADDALAALRAHRWPGNVRELHNAVTQAVMRCQGARIAQSDLPSTVRGGLPTAAPPAIASIPPEAEGAPAFVADVLMGLLQRARNPAEVAALFGGDREAIVTLLNRNAR
jgi:DNA-binding NtrC family response regulator